MTDEENNDSWDKQENTVLNENEQKKKKLADLFGKAKKKQLVIRTLLGLKPQAHRIWEVGWTVCLVPSVDEGHCGKFERVALTHGWTWLVAHYAEWG